MSRFGIRDFLIRALGGTPPDDEEEDERGGEVRMFVVGPNGPIPVAAGQVAPPGMPPHLAAVLGLGPPADDGRTDPSVNPSRIPTVRQGPASKEFAMRVIDCVEQLDPAADPEVQMLLSAGWEPFGVHKFASFTGAEGVRIYFKRGGVGRPRPGGPSPSFEG